MVAVLSHWLNEIIWLLLHCILCITAIKRHSRHWLIFFKMISEAIWIIAFTSSILRPLDMWTVTVKMLQDYQTIEQQNAFKVLFLYLRSSFKVLFLLNVAMRFLYINVFKKILLNNFNNRPIQRSLYLIGRQLAECVTAFGAKLALKSNSRLVFLKIKLFELFTDFFYGIETSRRKLSLLLVMQ